MAADQRRRRLNGASIPGCSSWEPSKMKKKKLNSSKNDLDAKSLISLKWDDNQNKVVARREQIGISRRDLKPFIDCVPQSHNVLADVFSLPPDIFESKNLAEVLTYEAWDNCLSENERNFLLQFLPTGLDAEEVVQALLSGDNFHFGNPFLRWGASLCSGSLHPDRVVFQEQCCKADQKAYYSELQDYHIDMIKYLEKLKGAWESSKDQEKEVLQKLWRRSRRDAEKRISSLQKESRFHDLGENVVATSESCSFVAEEKASSSDNQISPVAKDREVQKRMHEKGTMKKEKCRKGLLAASDDARFNIGPKLHKRNIHHSDGARYMSYFKISKKQHQLVKDMKQSGTSIQSKSLNRVLGNLNTLHVQPYEEFVKEEMKKLQEHWMQLAKKDLPAAYANWRERQFQRQEIIKSLEQDVKEKLPYPVEYDENEDHEIMLQDQNDQGSSQHETDMEYDENEDHEIMLQDQNDQGSSQHETDMEYDENEDHEIMLHDQNDQGSSQHETDTEDKDEQNHEIMLQDQNDGARNEESNIEYDGDSGSGSSQNQSLQHISSRCGDHNLSPIDMNLENSYDHMDPTSVDASPCVPEYSGSANAADASFGHGVPASTCGDVKPIDTNLENNYNHVDSRSDDASPHLPEYSGSVNAADASFGQGVPISNGGDVWSAVSMPGSYYESTANHEYSSTGGLSLPHQVNEQQHTQLIDLESEVNEEDTRKDLLNRQSDDGSFSSYTNHDRSGLLQSLFKGQGMSPYHSEQKQTGLDFHSPNNFMMENGQFTGHLQTSLPLEQGQKGYTEDYIQQNISEDIYSEQGGYLIPRQGHVAPVNLQDWNVNPARVSVRLQPQPNGNGLLTQNWISGEHQVRGGWTGPGGASVSNQSIGSSADQSLFSVLSQCNQLRTSNPINQLRLDSPINQLRSSGPFDSMGPVDQFALPRNYGMMSGGTPRISNSLPQVTHPLDYLSGRDTTSSLMPDDMGWLNLPHSSALPDPMGKPYIRSWHQ